LASPLNKADSDQLIQNPNHPHPPQPHPNPTLPTLPSQTQTDAALTRSSNQSPNFQSLVLPGTSGMTLVSTCCTARDWTTPPTQLLTGEALVIQSNLQAAFVAAEGDVTVWVTNSQGVGGGVAGAKVTLYFNKGYDQVGWMEGLGGMGWGGVSFDQFVGVG